MAFSPVQSPTPEVNFTSSKTPDPLKHYTSALIRPPGGLQYVGGTGQFVILATIFVFTFAQFFFFSTSYESLSPKISAWFDGEHDEMVIPMFFFLFTVLPVALSVLVFELLRHYNLHRVTSKHVVKVMFLLRLKPRLSGWLSPWSWGEILFVGVLLGGNVNVFYYYFHACEIYYRDSGLELNFTAYLDCCGLGLGYASMFNMAFLFLPSTRNSVWMEFLSISYANGIKYHRWVGVLTVVTALLHTIFYYWMYIREDMWSTMALPCFHCDAGDDGKAPWMNFLGLIALIAMLLISATSIPFVRRRLYSIFYCVHHLFVVAVIFSVLHYNPISLAILPTFVLYLISRTISSLNGSAPVIIREFITLGTDIVKISLQCATNEHYEPGHFVYLNIPAISKLQWHPFTIASSPRMSPDTITIIIKVHGDWTTQLAKYVDTCKENAIRPIVYMDGYYGASLEQYEKYSTVSLVGGGTGITPLLAILQDMVAKAARGDALTQKVSAIFTFRELAMLEEIHPLLMKIKELDPHENHFSIRLFLSRQPTQEQIEAQLKQRQSLEKYAGAIRYDTSVSQAIPVPFSVPVASNLTKSMMYLSTFIVICLVLAVLKYGQKIQASHLNLWPLQNFVEITLVFVIVPLVTFAFIFVDRRRHSPNTAASVTEYPAERIAPSDECIFQDLVAEHRVTIGARPDIHNDLKDILAEHEQQTGLIGVFISGPETLKISTRSAIAELGAKRFDAHEEEFEL
ncbi:unnamed protein product [Phytophthora lilii]|uniref:Unnamed protein product n=1 Tax=Phytophthora lilii TaxID=2077276 RepID=A0A9W6X2X0_9STRA|nr:unnamed protein product [Phytophthora lilii]